MELFERAHVSKNNNPSMKKADESVKKQLKKMLYGYKQSDNALINKAVNIVSDDDTPSVSGFSDLNLTSSSSESEVLQESKISDANNVTLHGFNEFSLNKSPTFYHKINDNTVSTASLSDCSEKNIQSLPFDEIDLSSFETREDISLDSSIINSSTNSASDHMEPFDPDGALAAKILERLEKNEKVTKHKKIKKKKSIEKSKRSSEQVKYKGPYRPKDDTTVKFLDEKDSHMDTNKVLKMTGGKVCLSLKPMEDDSSDQAAQEICLSDTCDDCSIDSMEQSSPFISVTAMDVPSQSLDDILGEYKHSTVKNLPCDGQNIVYCMRNSDVFSTEHMSLDDVTIDEEKDTDSLIPDVDTDLTENDILDTDFESSTALPNEESTVYDDTMQSEDISEREDSNESIDTTLLSPVKVYYGKNCCIFVLIHPVEIHIHGKVKVRALGGTIEIQGFTLQTENYEVYAPNYNYAQYLRTVESENAYYGLFGKLTSSGLSVSEAEDIVTTLGDYDGVISLQSLNSRKMDFVQNNFTVADLFGKSNKNTDNYFKTASERLGCSLYLSRPWKCFEENSSWKQVIKCGLQKQSRGVICGGKGVGKSTFLRYYINKLLAHGPVLLIDLDPGQCEFTVAGNVSATVVTAPLLGPNFTHLKTPDIMLNIGMINTMDNPKRYAAAVEALITHCSADKRLSNMPWIVNTMGMCNAMGLKFITLTILRVQPTFLLQIDSKNPKKRFESHLSSHIVKQLFEDYQHDKLFVNAKSPEDLEYTFVLCHHTENLVKSNFSLAPRDERYLNFLAYFGGLLNVKNTGLLDIVPYEVNLKDLHIRANVKIGEDSLMKVLNGKVIALCQHREHRAADNKVFTLADKPLLCHGHGLVRGIDWEKGRLYVITPTSANVLPKVNTLVYADWVPELRGHEEQLPTGTAVPYRTATAYQQRQFMFAPKRRFNPILLLKMSRNA